MIESLVIFIVVCLAFLYLRRRFTLDSRIDKWLAEECSKTGKSIVNIRTPNPKDGKNPFSKAFRIVGFGGGDVNRKNVFYRIVEVEGKTNLEKYWVEVFVLALTPSQAEWKPVLPQKEAEPYSSVYVFEDE